MAVLTNAGRAEIARAVKLRYDADPKSVLIGIGSGESWWGEPQAELATFANDTVTALHAPLTGFTLQNSDGTVNYVLGADYTLDLSAGIVSRVDGGGIAAGSTVRLGYTATTPDPTLAQDALVAEVGRVALTSLDYVLPLAEISDPSVPYVDVDGQRYGIVPGPSRMLLSRARLHENDAVGDPVRCYGVFIGSAVDAALPPGQQFYAPEDVTTSGTLTMVRHRGSPIPHDGTIALEIFVIIEV